MTMSNQGVVEATLAPSTDGDEPSTDSWSPAMSTSRRDTVAAGALAPLGTILARPGLIVGGALLGMIVGAGVTGSGGYSSEAVVQFTNVGNDSLLVKQIGQTIERQATAQSVIDTAATARGEDAQDLLGRVSATWKPDTQLVAISVKATTPKAASADADAVAKAMVAESESSIAGRLSQARQESNRLLNAERLSSADAESARRAQLGSALATRQDAIASESGNLVVADRAGAATPTGLTRPMGAAIGFVAGTLLAGLLSLLLGVRGIRASDRTVRHLVPGGEINSPAQVPQLAGRIVESGSTCVAVVAAPGARAAALSLTDELGHFLRAHGRTVFLIDSAELDRRQVLDLLGHRTRADIGGRLQVDMLVAMVDADSEGCALLEGQSDLRAIVVVRRRHTRVESAMRILRAFGRAEPAVVLAR